MSKRCPGCGAWIASGQIACPRDRRFIPAAIRADLVGLYIGGEWWTDSPVWIKAHAAAVKALRALRAAGAIVPAPRTRYPQPRPRKGAPWA